MYRETRVVVREQNKETSFKSAKEDPISIKNTLSIVLYYSTLQTLDSPID